MEERSDDVSEMRSNENSGDEERSDELHIPVFVAQLVAPLVAGLLLTGSLAVPVGKCVVFEVNLGEAVVVVAEHDFREVVLAVLLCGLLGLGKLLAGRVCCELVSTLGAVQEFPLAWLAPGV